MNSIANIRLFIKILTIQIVYATVIRPYNNLFGKQEAYTDASIVQTIIAAVVTIIAAFLTPLIQWALQSLPSKSLPQESRDKIYRIGFFCFAGTLIIGIVVTVVLFVSATSKYRSILPDFGLAKCSPFQSNSSMYFELQKGIPFPTSLDWMTPKTIELQDTSYYDVNTQDIPVTITTNPRLVGPVTECIFIESHLRPTHSWTGLMFSKGLSLFSLDLSKKSELLLVIKAELRDMLELGLKDINQNETKIKFAVMQGWHGYIIPMDRFQRVNKNRIHMLLISHSAAIKGVQNNQFWIGHLEFR